MIKEFTNYNFVKENLSLFVASTRRLRDAVHDIMYNDLKPSEEMTTTVLSEKLKDRYNIDISSKILDKLIFDNWWKKDDYSIFREKDKKWLDVWPYRKTVQIKKKKDSSFGRGRKKIEKKEREEKWKNNSTYYYYDRYGKKRVGRYYDDIYYF